MSETIRRANHGKEHPYYLATRASAQDKSISYEALGMLQYLLSKPNDWRVQPKDLVREGCGITKVYKLLKELIAAGYIERIYNRDEMGRVLSVEYAVDEVKKPLDEKPQMATPQMASPQVENADITEYRMDRIENDTISADLEGEPSAVALAAVDSTPKKKLPPHMLVDMPVPAAVSVEDNPKAKGDRISNSHPLARLYMTTYGINKLNKKEVDLLSDEISFLDEAGEPHNEPSLKKHWDTVMGFDEFVRARLKKAKATPTMKAVNALQHLRKLWKNDSAGWEGWLVWKDKYSAVTTLRKDEPAPVSDYQAPDEEPLPWKVQAQGVTE